ncbi:MAG: hypothetical protein IJ301_00150 [Clostridia bacterium]|nr:hypothetical protein [Clostridia bacterium]MBQ9785910.1 hypothetical protein [Clostridia bacterium]
MNKDTYCEYRICYTSPNSIYYGERYADGVYLNNGSTSGSFVGEKNMKASLEQYLKHIDSSQTLDKDTIKIIDNLLKTSITERGPDLEQLFNTLRVKKKLDGSLEILPVINSPQPCNADMIDTSLYKTEQTSASFNELAKNISLPKTEQLSR